MSSNPLVAQGTLNRLRGSVTVGSNAALNVTAPFLGTAGISMSLDGAVSDTLPTQTGFVVSPAPYQNAMIKVHLLKSQNLAALYKSQIETNCQIGNITVRPDSASLPDYNFSNCTIVAVDPLSFNGASPDFVVTLRGIYYINNSLWNV